MRAEQEPNRYVCNFGFYGNYNINVNRNLISVLVLSPIHRFILKPGSTWTI